MGYAREHPAKTKRGHNAFLPSNINHFLSTPMNFSVPSVFSLSILCVKS